MNSFLAIISLILFWWLLFSGNAISVEKQTHLNEQQIALLKTIDDSKLIQAINYNVARYGKNLYAIDKSFSETNITLEEIKQEKEAIKEKQQLINSTKISLIYF